MNTPRCLSSAAGGIAAVVALVPFSARAGEPAPWQMGFQEAASPTMERIQDLNVFLSVVIVAISILVMALLLYAVWRFSEKRNPTPATFHHNTPLEIAWTVIPVLILVAIAFPSFKLLYFMDKTYDPDLTLKITGHQWYWSYEYPDLGIGFASYMLEDNQLKEGQPRLLATDTEVVLPVGAKVQLLVTSADVIHSWAVPAFGVKKDAVPGRLNETWVQVDKPGVYYGQCSELCGVRHGFMPATVRVVEREEWDEWVTMAQKEFAMERPTTTVAAKN